MVFYKLSEKLLLLNFNKGKKVFDFDFWKGISSQKSETINRLKMLTMVSVETKVVWRDSFLPE